MKFIATVAELEAAKSETAKAVEALGLMEVRATTAEKSLADATASVGALTAERDALKAALDEQGAQAVAAKAALLAKEGELAALKAGAGNVAAVAAATVAAMGHEPISNTVKAGSHEDFMAALAAEKDPTKKALLWKGNKPKVLSAFHSNRN